MMVDAAVAVRVRAPLSMFHSVWATVYATGRSIG